MKHKTKRNEINLFLLFVGRHSQTLPHQISAKPLQDRRDKLQSNFRIQGLLADRRASAQRWLWRVFLHRVRTLPRRWNRGLSASNNPRPQQNKCCLMKAIG